MICRGWSGITFNRWVGAPDKNKHGHHRRPKHTEKNEGEWRAEAELDRIKTDFFSNVTHEFRTPLTLILEPVRQLLKKDLNGEIRQQLSLVRNNGEKMLALVNQLLDMAKMEEGKMELDLRRGDILETIRPIFQSFLNLADKKGIQLKMSGLREVEPFYFDKTKIFWVGPSSVPQELESLYKSVRNCAQSCGISKLSKRYVPHVALLR